MESAQPRKHDHSAFTSHPIERLKRMPWIELLTLLTLIIVGSGIGTIMLASVPIIIAVYGVYTIRFWPIRDPRAYGTFMLGLAIYSIPALALQESFIGIIWGIPAAIVTSINTMRAHDREKMLTPLTPYFARIIFMIAFFSIGGFMLFVFGFEVGATVHYLIGTLVSAWYFARPEHEG